MIKRIPWLTKEEKELWGMLEEKQKRAFWRYTIMLSAGWAFFLAGLVWLLYFANDAESVLIPAFLMAVGAFVVGESWRRYSAVLRGILIGGYWLPKDKQGE